MKRIANIITALTISSSAFSQNAVDAHCHNILPDNHKTLDSPTVNTDSMLIRISEIDIYPQYIDEYIKAALTVGANSVANEEGVICIYPMIQKRDKSKVRILEIYRDMSAYKHHITTPWFNAYKKGTLHMVKNLDLVDMHPMNPADMPNIFRKMPLEYNTPSTTFPIKTKD